MSGARFFQVDEEYRNELRAAFDPAQIGKLPRIWCRACSAAAKQGQTCDQHQKVKCPVCGANTSSAHIHIDYLGHANVTDRLNHAAPDWSYTIDRIEERDGHIVGIQGSMSLGGKSLPEVGEVSRPSSWGEELKLAVSDFICRGAMRFGVGLDLWIKGEAAEYDTRPAGEGPSDPTPPAEATVPGAEVDTLAYGEGVSGSDSPGTTVEPPGVAHPPGELDATSTAVDSEGGGASTEGHAPTSDALATPELWQEAMAACDIWTKNKLLSEFVKVFQPEHSVSVATLRGSDLRRLIDAKTNQEALG